MLWALTFRFIAAALLSAIEALEDTAAHVVELTKLDPEELEKMDPFDLK
mgnify:CR=1 FL=1